jgi:histidine phosphotransferase ChpT
VARGLIANDRTALRWNGQRRLARKNSVKLLLNLCLIAAGAIPRGGVISVDLEGEGESITITIEAAGPNARLSHGAATYLSGGSFESVDGHTIQPYYTALLAKECAMTIATSTAPDSITLKATPGLSDGEIGGRATSSSGAYMLRDSGFSAH